VEVSRSNWHLLKAQVSRAEQIETGKLNSMKRLLCAVAPVAVIATPAIAGEEVVYGEAPEWVAPVDVEAAIAEKQDVVIYDRQIRLEDGTVTKYTDITYEIASTQALQRYGTLQFSWLPDKGELAMHRLQILLTHHIVR
jgi:hypothetical protein